MVERTKKTVSKASAKNISIDGRVLPNNFEAEQAVLGCALIDSEATLLVVSRLTEIDFYNETHRNIFIAIRELFKKPAPVDFLSVADELEKKGLLSSIGGITYLSTLSNLVPSAASCSHYIDILKRNSILRQLIQISGNIVERAYDKDADINLVGVAEQLIYEIAEKGQSGALEKIDTSVQSVIDNFEEIHREGGSVHGLRTGFYQIDKATNGLQKTDLIILAARPGVGKTSLAMNIASNAAIYSHAKCAIFSLEMGREQLARRMLCSVANVSMAKGLRGELDASDWEKIWKAKKKLDEAEIYIDDNAMNTPSQILSKCRKLKREKGLDLVVIDYIGLMKSDEKTDNRQNEVASISRQLKILAKDIEVPVITLCQLNRSIEQAENNKDGKPRKPVLSDLRESGSIEQDADMVWFIHRDMTRNEIDKEPNQNYTAELIIAKFRNGQPGSVYLGWDGSRTSFVNLEKDANEQSIVNAYESNNLGRKKPTESIDDIKSKLSSIVNEITTNGVKMDENDGGINESEVSQIFEESFSELSNLTPPPETDDNDLKDSEPLNDDDGLKLKDFSDVNISTDDDLF